MKGLFFGLSAIRQYPFREHARLPALELDTPKGYGLCVYAKSKTKMKAKVKELTSRCCVNDYEKWKTSLKRFIIGWVNYYMLANMEKYLKGIDEWMRRRIRMVFWKKWKRIRTRWRNLLRLASL